MSNIENLIRTAHAQLLVTVLIYVAIYLLALISEREKSRAWAQSHQMISQRDCATYAIWTKKHNLARNGGLKTSISHKDAGHIENGRKEN